MWEKIVAGGINGLSINKDFDVKKFPKFQTFHVKNGSSVKLKKKSKHCLQTMYLGDFWSYTIFLDKTKTKFLLMYFCQFLFKMWLKSRIFTQKHSSVWEPRKEGVKKVTFCVEINWGNTISFKYYWKLHNWNQTWNW